MPVGPAATPTAVADWRDYQQATDPQPFGVQRRLWQDFLARRHAGIASLIDEWEVNWPGFDAIPIPQSLPTNVNALLDWVDFEAIILPTLTSAHWFSVLLPVNFAAPADEATRRGQLELARRLIELEKPAHTVFDVKFYWDLFRLDQARLDYDTVLGRGGRDPALLSPAVLNHSYFGESVLAPSHPMNVAERQVLGRDRLARKSRKPS